MRCQVFRAECSTLKSNSWVSVEACPGRAAVGQRVKMLDPDILVVKVKEEVKPPYVLPTTSDVK